MYLFIYKIDVLQATNCLTYLPTYLYDQGFYKLPIVLLTYLPTILNMTNGLEGVFIKVKLGMNSLRVHPQVSNNKRLPLGGELGGC